MRPSPFFAKGGTWEAETLGRLPRSSLAGAEIADSRCRGGDLAHAACLLSHEVFLNGR